MSSEEQQAMNIHTPIISFLVCTGLGTNFMFLMSLKADKPRLNNNDKIQFLKTGFVLMAIIFYIPSEIWAMQEGKNTKPACLVKETLQSLFLDSFPVGIAAIAIVRFRLAICRGNADILVNRAFFLTVSVSCALLSLIIATTKLFVRIGSTEFWDGHETGDYCFDVRYFGTNYLNIASIMIMYVFPTALITGLYIGLVRISSSSISRIQQFRQAACAVSNTQTVPRISIFGRPSIMPTFAIQNPTFPNVSEHQTRGTRIRHSVITLVVFFLISSLPVSTVEIYKSVVYCSLSMRIAILYLKTMMCIFHAIGEGAFHKEKRRRIMMFLYKYLSTSTSTSVIRRMSHDVRRTVIFHTNAQLSTLKEESSEHAQPNRSFEGISVSQDDVFTNGDESPRHETSNRKQDQKFGSNLSIRGASARDKRYRSSKDSFRSRKSTEDILGSPRSVESPSTARRCQGSSFHKQSVKLITGHRRNGGKFSPVSPVRRAMPQIEETFLYDYPVSQFSFTEKQSGVLGSPRRINVAEMHQSSASFLDVEGDLNSQLTQDDKEILKSSIQRISVICDTM